MWAGVAGRPLCVRPCLELEAAPVSHKWLAPRGRPRAHVPTRPRARAARFNVYDNLGPPAHRLLLVRDAASLPGNNSTQGHLVPLPGQAGRWRVGDASLAGLQDVAGMQGTMRHMATVLVRARAGRAVACSTLQGTGPRSCRACLRARTLHRLHPCIRCAADRLQPHSGRRAAAGHGAPAVPSRLPAALIHHRRCAHACGAPVSPVRLPCVCPFHQGP